MKEKLYRKGFTLIELALSMAFVGLLTLAIALVIRDTVASYRRGLTLNQVNTVGMDVVDDIRAAVQNSSSKSVENDCIKYYYSLTGAGDPGSAYRNCKEDQGYNFVYWVKKETITLTRSGQVMSDVPIYGAFCTGTYSYIWNSGYFETDEATFPGKDHGWARLTYLNSAGNPVTVVGSLRNIDMTAVSGNVGNPDKPFRLLKVRDDRRGVCAGVIRSGAGDNSYQAYNGDLNALTAGFGGTFNMTAYVPVDDREPPVDIITTDKTYDLAIYDLFAARPAISSTQKNMFYSSSFILGTVNGGINILANGKSCAAPSEYMVENYDYCSINKFTFAAQSGIE